MVSTKAALSIRVDALSDAESRSDPQAAEIGITNRVKLESRLRALEHRAGIQSVRKVTTGMNGRLQPRFEMTGATGSYNTAADSIPLGSAVGLLPTQPQASVQAAVGAVLEVKEEKRAEKNGDGKKKKDKKKRKSEAAAAADESMEADGGVLIRPRETKEERRARKEAKKAVGYLSCFSELQLTVIRPRQRRSPERSLMVWRLRLERRRSQIRGEQRTQRTGHQLSTATRRRKRRRASPRRRILALGWLSVVVLHLGFIRISTMYALISRITVRVGLMRHDGNCSNFGSQLDIRSTSFNLQLQYSSSLRSAVFSTILEEAT